MYANGDSFFGQYSADKRSGQGLYVFAKGGVHAGQRQQGWQAIVLACSKPDSSYHPVCIGAGDVALLWQGVMAVDFQSSEVLPHTSAAHMAVK